MSRNIGKTPFSEPSVDKPPICVRDVMTSEINSLSPRDTLAEAVCLMATRHVDHLLVVDDAGAMVGIVSYSDVLYAAAYRPDSRSKEVQQIMTRNPDTVKHDTPLSTATSKIVAK